MLTQHWLRPTVHPHICVRLTVVKRLCEYSNGNYWDNRAQSRRRENGILSISLSHPSVDWVLSHPGPKRKFMCM